MIAFYYLLQALLVSCMKINFNFRPTELYSGHGYSELLTKYLYWNIYVILKSQISYHIAIELDSLRNQAGRFSITSAFEVYNLYSLHVSSLGR